MSTSMAAALGIGAQFEFKGRIYTIAPRDFEIEGLFSIWLEQQALELIQRHYRNLSPSEYELQLAGWRRDGVSQLYDLSSPEGWRASVSLPGRKQMALLQLQKGSGPKVTMDLIEQIFDDPDAIRRFEACREIADRDPNRPRPWHTSNSSGSGGTASNHNDSRANTGDSQAGAT